MSDVSAYGSKQRYLLRECFWLIVITEEWTMRKTPKSPGEKIVKDIKRVTLSVVRVFGTNGGLN